MDSGFEKLLLTAASSGDLDFLKKHSEMFLNLKAKDASSRTAVHLAAGGGHSVVCEFLVHKLGCDVNAQDCDGNTPLMIAIEGKHKETAMRLITECIADVFICNRHGLAPLQASVITGNTEVLELLISKGVDVNTQSVVGTPLLCAVNSKEKGSVKVLLDNKADPNLMGGSISTPLVQSIANNDFDCFILLLERGANPDLASYWRTPLSLAAALGETKVVKCLLEYGANADAPDEFGLKAFEHAAFQRDAETMELLFPLTSCILSFPNWSVNGVLEYYSTFAGGFEIDLKLRMIFEKSKQKGKEAFDGKNYPGACAWYTAALHVNPDEAAVLSRRSQCWEHLKQGELALDDARKYVVLSPTEAMSHYRLGTALMLLEDFAEAAKAFGVAMNLNPEDKDMREAYVRAQTFAMKLSETN